ncbi:hypothetical protein HELRODRAFT_166975 [Helobdella robusta]|uniref:Uncharacterized protein n=1 Tax=Helobdella robusta TaxID=6412 RepID=T1EYU1_HELRO|nr:hypothetical protein HELRODRAFT_166975 [Helobdella robusta]ESO11886.1 hypothetical protein HELRODRAFT_166975 [Helobdella robusta]
MSTFSKINKPTSRNSRYQSSSTTELYQSIPSLMVNDQLIQQTNGFQQPRMFNRNTFYSNSSDIYQNLPNTNKSSINMVDQENVIKTLPKSVFSKRTLSRSFDDLTTIKYDTSKKQSTILDNADPELKNVKKTGASYHVSVDLKKIFLSGTRPKSSFARHFQNYSMPSKINKISLSTNQQHTTNNGFNTQRSRIEPLMLEGNRTSVVNLISAEINQVTPHENLHVKPKATNYPSKAVININLPKNNVSSIMESDSKERNFSLKDGYIIKSLKPSEITRETASQQILKNNNVDFDLCLYGTVFKQADSSNILNSQIIDIKPSIVEDFEQTTRSKTRKIIEIDETNLNKTPAKKKFEEKSRKAKRTINSFTEYSAPVEESFKIKTTSTGVSNTEPTSLPKSLNTDPEKESKEIQTLSTKNKLIQTDYYLSDTDEYVGPRENDKKAVMFVDDNVQLSSKSQVKAIPIKNNEKMIPVYDETFSEDEFDGYENNIPQSVLSNLQTNYDLSDDENIIFQRLMKNAPEGSLKQNINVENRYVNYLGPYSNDQVREKYEKKEINVDHVAQRVELMVNNGMVTIKLQLTFQKTVPYKNTHNTFKQTTLLINKIIIVDLTVTDERRQIYEEVLQNHKNGRLDKVYTWKLYKIFSAMALADKGMGIDDEHVSIEKKIEENKKLNLDSTDYLDYQMDDDSFKNLDKRAAEIGVNQMIGANFNKISQSGLGTATENFINSENYAWNNTLRNANLPSDIGKENLYNNYFDTPENKKNDTYNSKANTIRVESIISSHKSGPRYNFEDGYVGEDQNRNLLIVDHASESRLNQVKENINKMQNSQIYSNGDLKSTYGRWLSTGRSDSRMNRIGQRFDVYNYLRPGGSRNYSSKLQNQYSNGLDKTNWDIQITGGQNDHFEKNASKNETRTDYRNFDNGSYEHRKRMASYKSSSFE